MHKITSIAHEGLSPFSGRDFRIHMAGQAVSMLGNWMYGTAHAWLVWQLSHSTVALGVAGAMGMLPFLILGPWAGPWADRVDRRRLLIVLNALSMVQVLVLAALVEAETVRLWHVYLLTLILGCVGAVTLPAQHAFLADLTGVVEVRRAVVLHSNLLHGSRILGPALAGVLIPARGIPLVLGLYASALAAAIGCLLLVRSVQDRSPSRESAVRQFADGVRFIARQGRVQDLLLLSMLITFFGISNGQLMPAFATRVLAGDAQVLGMLLGASGVGALLGSLLAVVVTARVRPVGILLGAAAVWAGLSWVFVSVSTAPSPLTVGVMSASVAAPIIGATASGMLQVLSPPDMRGRLLSIWLMLSLGVQPLAFLAVGFVAGAFGPSVAVRTNGFLLILGAGALLAFRSGLSRWRVGVDAAGGDPDLPLPTTSDR